MSALPFARRFLFEAARTPVNFLVLVVVPVTFVVVAAAPLADAAKLLGGPGGPAVQTATAGWAAGFIAAIAMYFQIRGARAPDRRLVLAGLSPARLLVARGLTGLALALVAAAGALVALAVRTGLGDEPARVIAGTLMFAVVYLAIGALVGALVSDPVNGTVLVLFVWILDVFFGPVLGAADLALTRGLPTHFVTLWAVDLPSRHGGQLGDLGWALAWVAAALAVGSAVIVRTSRLVRPRPTARNSMPGQLVAGIGMGLREAARNRVLWPLLVAVPMVFVLLAVATTPGEFAIMKAWEGGRLIDIRVWLPDVHGGTMAPIAIGSLAALTGLFTVLDSRRPDQRLALAGFRPASLLGARLVVVAAGALLATAASLAVTALVFDPARWDVYVLGNVLIALTYAMIGALLGPVFGRVGGVLIAFLLPFIDLGIEQSAMLHPVPPDWARTLPGYGASRLLIDGALTPSFDEMWPLALALGWLVGLLAAVGWVFGRATRTSRQAAPYPAGGAGPSGPWGRRRVQWRDGLPAQADGAVRRGTSAGSSAAAL
ncbi:ABC transporter permease [Blastococcus sp. TF02-8]|uniref:ABC transporter permease n=1 Tax=Blastococcus sp. TF02-8 TaxID=2250574 RepID=UPI000DEAFA31|nr:ABC transporter permease [Blastococcus sp. TF02-8]RBY97520.1 ABC transporter permease [Blastococcus sp. TF02-8]